MRGSCLIFKMVVLLFAAALLIPAKSLSQENVYHDFRHKYSDYFIFDVQGGMVIPNEPSDNDVLGGVGVASVDFGVGSRVVGQEYWINYWKNPYFGVKLGYDHIMSNVLGRRITLGTFLEMPINNGPRWEFGYLFGFGISYMTKTYDSISNPQDMFIGSHLNALINLGLTANYHLSDKTIIYSAVKFSHSSNGTVQLPNKGVNLVELELGAKVNYYSQYIESLSFENDDVANRPYNSIFINLSPVYNSSRKTWEHYFSASASIGYRRKFHPCFAYGAGVDFMYDASLEQAHEPHSITNDFAVSGYGLLEAYWGRFSLRGAVGYYAWRGCDFTLPFYERIGVYYSFGRHDNHYFGASIKAHAAHAQFLEWTYGISVFSW